MIKLEVDGILVTGNEENLEEILIGYMGDEFVSLERNGLDESYIIINMKDKSAFVLSGNTKHLIAKSHDDRHFSFKMLNFNENSINELKLVDKSEGPKVDEKFVKIEEVGFTKLEERLFGIVETFAKNI